MLTNLQPEVCFRVADPGDLAFLIEERCLGEDEMDGLSQTVQLEIFLGRPPKDGHRTINKRASRHIYRFTGRVYF